MTGCDDYVDMISSIIAPQNQLHNHELGRGRNGEATGRASSVESVGNAKFRKIGSLQSFAESLGPVENFSSDLFSIDEVHKIAILDLRMMNLDRNECNILVHCDDQ